MNQTLNSADRHVLTEIRGSIGHICLNRPEALNALNHAMVRALHAAIRRFAADDTISALMITGAGERGLCAGGDIREIRTKVLAGDTGAAEFLRDEYRMNAEIAALSKPYIAFMDGIVMGGGAGVSVHGSHRIVTERTRFAMPETGIGLLPDIGATWFLSLPENEFGTYMGLTGASVGAADALRMQLADAFVPSDRLPQLKQALFEADFPDGESLTALIARFSTPAPESPLRVEHRSIELAFRHNRVEDILAALKAENSKFTNETARLIESRSPVSLKLTLALLRIAASAERLADCQEREFAAGSRIIFTHDFIEGVRAAVIDKDRNPQWQPATLSAVDDAMIEALIAPVDPPLFDRPTGKL